MKRHLTAWKTAFISSLFLLHLPAIGGVSNGYALTVNGANSTSLYRAPSHYSKDSPLQSFIITSRPMSFYNDPQKQEGNSLKSPIIQTNSKGFLTSVPGVATVVCKGISCANSPTSFSDWPSEEDGFPGEAIPVQDETEYMTAMVGQQQPPAIVDITSASKIKSGSTQSVVHLLTNRPYLRRGSNSKLKTQAPTRKVYAERRSSTMPTSTATTTTTTRRRPVAQAQAASSTSRPTIMLQRHSLLFPAMAAFGLMALPVAAAAVPLLLQGRRRRRSLPAMSRVSPEDISEFPEDDFQELMSGLENLENENQSLEWPVVGQRHLAKVTNARRRLQKLGMRVRRR